MKTRDLAARKRILDLLKKNCLSVPEISKQAKVSLRTTYRIIEEFEALGEIVQENGLWTYYFLEFTLINYFNSNPRTTMEEAFDYASLNFKFQNGVMIPEEYDGNLDEFFLLI